MKIGVDLCDLDPDYAGGVNTFAIGLVRGFIGVREEKDRLVILVSDRNEEFLRRTLIDTNIAFLRIPINRWQARIDTLLFNMSWAVRNFKLCFAYDRVFRARFMREIDNAIDVLVAPTGLLKFSGLRVPSLLSVHDIQQEYHPEFFALRDRVRRWAPYRLSCWRASAIQASSQYIRSCLIEKFAFVKPEGIFVIPEGVDFEKFSLDVANEQPPALADLCGDFVFYPAQLWPHKNHLMLIDALALHRDETGTELPCVLTGQEYGYWSTVLDRVKAHGLSKVHYLGRVSFEQLLWLYRNCSAVLALGLHESSSLPLREGAVFGKVLLCSDIPPNREVRDFLNVTLVACDAPQDLASAFAALSKDRANVMAAGMENAHLARRFDWKTIAAEYFRVLTQLV
jgi:glycosyltransferase involved in cell wall biosynthesis